MQLNPPVSQADFSVAFSVSNMSFQWGVVVVLVGGGISCGHQKLKLGNNAEASVAKR